MQPFDRSLVLSSLKKAGPTNANMFAKQLMDAVTYRQKVQLTHLNFWPIQLCHATSFLSVLIVIDPPINIPTRSNFRVLDIFR